MDYAYQTIYQGLPPWEMAAIIYKIQNSLQYELDDLSHVVLRGSDTRVGYLGDDSLELVNPADERLKKHHKSLVSLCDSAIADFSGSSPLSAPRSS